MRKGCLFLSGQQMGVRKGAVGDWITKGFQLVVLGVQAVWGIGIEPAVELFALIGTQGTFKPAQLFHGGEVQILKTIFLVVIRPIVPVEILASGVVVLFQEIVVFAKNFFDTL
jgi:hypothetical protein